MGPLFHLSKWPLNLKCFFFSKDNLKMEGSFEGRKTEAAALKGERANVQRHEDNLKMEGKYYHMKCDLFPKLKISCFQVGGAAEFLKKKNETRFLLF